MRNQQQLTLVIVGSDQALTNTISRIASDVKEVVVLEATQGITNALEAISTLQPQVVILDANLPKFGSMNNGIDVLRWTKQNHPDIQVVMLISHNNSPQQAISEQLGAYECLDRSTGLAQLGRVLRELHAAYATKSLDGASSHI